MLRIHPVIRASRSRRWLTKKSRYQNTRAKDRTTARARAVARIGGKMTAKAKEAAQPIKARQRAGKPFADVFSGWIFPWVGVGVFILRPHPRREASLLEHPKDYACKAL